LGRSRGGLTTKLHVACVDEATAVAVLLTEGQRHDSVPFSEVYAQARETGRVQRVIADKAYDGNPIRELLAADGVKTTIPSPAHRRTKSRCLRRFYRRRHKVENYFRKLFDFRRVATRYDKLASTYLAFVHLAAATVLIRHFVNTP
jgi:transposase